MLSCGVYLKFSLTFAKQLPTKIRQKSTFKKHTNSRSSYEYTSKKDPKITSAFEDASRDERYFIDNFKDAYGSDTHNHFLDIITKTEESAVAAHANLSISKLDKYFKQLKVEEEYVTNYKLEYAKSRERLALIMDRKPEDFTDEEVEQSIQYLIPSDLSAKECRPFLKPPNELQGGPRFDQNGRPLHFLFYTGHAVYYSIMHEIATLVDRLKELSDSKQPNDNKFSMEDFRWFTAAEVRKRCNDKTLTDEMCKNLISSVKFLSEMDYSATCSEFIRSFCGNLVAISHEKEITSIVASEDGIKYVRGEGGRKTARAGVTLKSPGNGLFTVNGQSILYFKSILDRHQLLGPLCLSNLINKVDISGRVKGGGNSSQAGALRLAISRALSMIITPEEVEKMRQAGYLTRDPRIKERKKPGKEGARRGYTWLKR